ncbi:type VI secretion system tip protein VgrG [Aquincola tertiaricarbonis]|uniref:Type VI secretion system tip protein VgrG n=1 Tax=Aquincola tertiaricarbonis TaxID=391953 RepID=A0ABY4SAY7_AQUTE|nr:type VI secretion system tip protein VgrG [Aquincola tertiaricarbonis]URI08898.1 type VI secretion system tip protein VgrG [Aquincola tertiaricarbonis]
MPEASDNPLMKLTTPLGEEALKFRSLSATEEVGRLFEFHVAAVAGDPAVDIDSLVGQTAHVSLELPDASQRHLHGVVASVGLEGFAAGWLQVRLVLRPWLWLLTRRADTRIFQHKNAQEILAEVFGRYVHAVRFDISGSLPTYEYCVQYRESDFNFVSRLMEQEGLYYYFEHTDSQHTMVVVNAMSAHTPYRSFEQVPFAEQAYGSLTDEFINEWRSSLELHTGKVTLNDYNFTTPETSLSADASSDGTGADDTLEHYDPPGDYQAASAGTRYAGLRVDELAASARRKTGSGSVRTLAAGSRFRLQDHPRDAENAEYVLLSTRIDAGFTDQSSGQPESWFRCSFTAIDAATVYRPPRITPKPTVPGPQTAVVVGKSTEEIDTDEYGRVKLHFHWDRLGEKNENSSCWVRVATPSAGKGFGMIAVPRIGQEVVVDFIEGDPDRPLVTGSVYNATQVVPYELPANKTVSTWRSQSSKEAERANFNELRFEDKKGSEYVWFHAEKDYYQQVKNDSAVWVGRDAFRIVTRDLKEDLQRDVERKMARDLKESVGRDQSLKITGKSANEVGGAYGLKVTGDLVQESAAVVSVKSGADMVHKVGANLGVEAAANVHIKGGANVVIEAGATLTLKCGSSSVVLTSGDVSITGTMVKVNSGGSPGAGNGASPKSPEAPAEPAALEKPEDPLP